MTFIYSRPLYHHEFIGRRRALRRVTGRLKTQQNTILVGTPHTGKTSFLSYVEGNNAQDYWGEEYDKLIFRHLDVHTLLGLQTQAAFWERVLNDRRVHNALGDTYAVYERAEANAFGTFMLELLFKALHAKGYQLLLLLDEFDTFLSHPILNSAEFYGSLRSLSSRFPSLTLLLATRLSTADLNRETQDFAPHGSPYFNTFTEYQLGPLSGRDFEAVLRPASFDTDQRRFVLALSGQHPFLTQLTAGALWENRDEGLNGDRLYRRTADQVHRGVYAHFLDCWDGWTPNERKALTAVSLVQMPYLIHGQTANVSDLANRLDSYTPELERLEPSGIVRYDDDTGWRIRQELFVWWLADDLVRRLHDDLPFDSWLQQQMMDGVLTHREKELFGQATKAVGEIIGQGSKTFIEAYAQTLAGQ